MARTPQKTTRPRGRPAVPEITAPQRRALEAVQRLAAERKIPPTVQELADALGVSKASAHEQVSQLVRKGFLARDPHTARSLRIVQGATEPASELAAVPLVGAVAAGTPLLAEENVIGDVLIDAAIVKQGPCFALAVQGDSMRNADLWDGDLVIVRQQPLAAHGEIVVALVDGEATLKRLFWSGDRIELRPENPKYKPIVIGPDTDLRILGRMVAKRRRPRP